MKKEEVIEKINPLFLKGIAHRGLWNEMYAENSLGAFKNAIDNSFAFECDIHLTKDKRLVVCHDSDLKRMTGKDGVIEKLTLSEIKDNYTLTDGSKIPTLREVFDLNQERVPMAIELKIYKGNYRRLIKELKKEITVIKDPKNYFFISFDPRALFLIHHIDSVKGLIAGINPFTWFLCFRKVINSLDIDRELLHDKRVVTYNKKRFLNTWTIETKEQFDEAYPIVDTVTFQKIDPEYVREKLTEKNF